MEGALVQIGMVANLVYKLLNDEVGAYRKKCIEERFKRLTFSAVRALAKDVDLSLTELGVWRDLGEHLNPWTPYERHVARLPKRPDQPFPN